MRLQIWVVSVMAFSTVSSVGGVINSLKLNLPSPSIESSTRQRLQAMNETANFDTFSNQPDASATKPPFPHFNGSGVVLFYHLAKTGGVTIEQHFNKLKHIKYIRAWDQAGFDKIAKDIDTILNGEKKQILFVEMHGGEPKTRLPGLMELHSQIQTWRTYSTRSSIPFFSFTMLRDPVSIHTSAFLFFHRKRCTASWCSKKRRYLPHESNIIKSATPNRQCMTLARGQHHEDFWINTNSEPVTEKECLEVETLLRQDWDWVGQTGTMSNTTLPLMKRMLYHGDNESKMSNTKSFNVNRTPQSPMINPKKLQEKTKKALLDLSMLDSKLYEAFRGEWSEPLTDSFLLEQS